MVDAIVALTLASLAIVMVGATYPYASRARKSSLEHAAAIEDLRAVGVIGEIIGRARPIVSVSPGRAPEALFTGTAATMRMVSDFVGTTEVGGPYQVDLAIEKAEAGGSRLVLMRSVFHPQVLDRKSEQRVIARALRSARFRYFGRETPASPGTWRDSWRNEQALPDLVALDLDFGRGGAGMHSIVVEMVLRR